MLFMETGITACPRESAALEHVIYERALRSPFGVEKRPTPLISITVLSKSLGREAT
jgi:hypothetical protein